MRNSPKTNGRVPGGTDKPDAKMARASSKGSTSRGRVPGGTDKKKRGRVPGGTDF